ncbi:hypothetical protein [Pseudoalteromonas sp. GB43]
MHAHTVIESAATIQSGVAKADGKLVVTEQDIVFEPFNKELGLNYHTHFPERKSITLVSVQVKARVFCQSQQMEFA